jgi:ATP-dependent protease Clp ATPase subunit
VEMYFSEIMGYMMKHKSNLVRLLTKGLTITFMCDKMVTYPSGALQSDANQPLTPILGTMSYFFSLQDVQHRFESEGFQTIANEYIYRETTNRKLELAADRIFTQCKFVKP